MTSNDFSQYQEATEETAIYPDELPEFIDAGTVYTAMGVSDEAGEVAGKVKKAVRENDPSYLEDVEDELGDVLWYVAGLARELDIDLGEVAEKNLQKLLDRQERGVLEGEGDDR